MQTATIIISSYNYAEYLPQAIESALRQTHSDTEVIVVDDGSTDKSRDVITSYGERIRPILKENSGQASAFNAGFGLSRGQCIVFLDSDDVLLPTAVEKAIELLAHPGVAKVHWPLAVMDQFGKDTNTLLRANVAEGDLRTMVLQLGPFSYAWSPTSGNAWARSFLERVLPMPEEAYRTCPDLYLSGLVPLFGAIARIDHPLTLWRDHGANASFRDPFEVRLAKYVDREDHCVRALATWCARLGLPADPDTWRANSWWHQIKAATDQILALVPLGCAFILVDEEAWDMGPMFAGRPRFPFLESEGRYWGAPPDDGAAIHELERLRSRGATFIVFAPSAFWWLNHYTGLLHYLDTRFARVLDSPLAIIFDMRTPRRGDSCVSDFEAQ